MGFRVDGETVDLLLNGKVFELPVVVGIIHLEDGDRSTRTGDIDSSQAGIEFDDVRAAGHRQKCDGPVLLYIEHGHEIVPLARKECAVMFRVQRHSVVSLAAAHWIAADYFVARRIDDGKMFSSCKFTYTFLATGSYCGIPVSLLK